MTAADGEVGTPHAHASRSPSQTAPQRRIPIAVMLALLVAAAMGPLVAFGAFGINRLVSSARDQELERLSVTARTISKATDRELRGYRETAEVFALSHHLERGNLAAFADAAYDAVAAAGGHFVLIDEKLQQIFNTQVPPGTPLPQTDNPAMIRRVFETGRPEVGDLTTGTLTRHVHFPIRVPISVGGRVTYVLVMIPRGDLIPRLVAEQQLGQLGWFAAVLDGNGRIVARSARHAEFFGRPATTDFLARLGGGEGQIVSTDLEGRPSITAFHVSPGTGWRTIVWAPEDVIFGPARDAERLILVLALLAMTLSLGSAIVAGRLIRTPLRRTVAAAQALAAARSVDFHPSRLLEAHEIGSVLHTAAAALRAREAALEAAEARLRLAQEVADIGIIDWDIAADRADVSDGIMGIYGEVAGAWCLGNAWQGFLSTVHPEDRARVEADHLRLRRGGGRFASDFRILRRGETRWISATGQFTGGSDAVAAQRMLAVNVDITDRKRIELGLRDRDATLHLALDAAYAIAFTWNIEEDRVRRLHSSEPILPANENGPSRLADVVAAIHPDDRVLFRSAIDTALATPGLPYRSRFRILRPGGTVRWLEEWGRVEREPDGTPSRLVGISIDVTERRRIEAELAERLAEVESLYEAAPIGLALFDRDLRFRRVNATLARINGLPVEAHLERGVWEILPGFRPLMEPLFERVLAGGEIEEIEVSGETPAQPGVTRHWAEKIYPLKSVQGDVIGIGVLVEEITARRHAERQMARYAAIVVATHDALIGLDAEGLIDAWNPGAERLFGWTAAEAIGRTAAFIGIEGAAYPPAELTRRVLAGEDIGPLDVQRRRKDGTRIEVSLTARPVRDGDGRVVGIAAALHDIGERKRREAQMRFVMRELTHRSKNLLAVIQAMARQTARSTVDAEAFVDRFADRLAALARSHDLLVSQDWVGVDLRALLLQQLAPFVDEGDGRVDIEGPGLVLKPEVTQSLGMAFHELATNASKHGALSVPDGHVDVAWTRVASGDGDRIRITWREAGGPPFAPPTRRGFGRTVTERMVAAATQGEAHVEWLPEGLSWRLEMPASWVAEDGTAPR
jgi:PAS domain S-box-containing protein